MEFLGKEKVFPDGRRVNSSPSWGKVSVAAVLAAALAAASALASGPPDVPGGSAGQGIPIGNYVLYPTGELIYQYEDNLFLTPPNVKAVKSASYVVRPKLLLEMPFLRTYFKTGYSGEYRKYDAKEYNQPEHWTHIVMAEGSVNLASGIFIRVHERYVRSVLYTEEFDPNREIQWGTSPFATNRVSADAGYRFNPRLSAELNGGLTRTRFDDSASASKRNFFDYTTFSWGGGAQLRLTPLTEIYVAVSTSDTSRDRAYQGLVDGLRSRSRSLTGGISGGLTPTMSGSVFFGYSWADYDKAPNNPLLTQGRYRGLIYGLDVKNRFSSHTTIAGRVWRQESQSSSLGSNYYVTVGGTASITHNLSRSIFLSGGLAFQQNSYATNSAVLNIKRDDDTTSIRVGMGLYFNERASVRVNYQYRERDSSINFLDYKNNLYVVEVQAGW